MEEEEEEIIYTIKLKNLLQYWVLITCFLRQLLVYGVISPKCYSDIRILE
jgi:hypothetical protein